MARILIVDDEKSLRLTLGEFLREAGHEVETAEDVDSAQRLLFRQPFDVVVVDIILPRVSGVELLKQVRAQTPDTQVIIMTGEPTVETAVEAVRAGAHDYLAKPVQKATIQHAVARAVRLKTLLDEKARLEAMNQEYQDNLEWLVEERTRSLQESRTLYRSLVENLPQYVFRRDLEGRFTFVNQRFCQSLGKTPEELLGKTGMEVFPSHLAAMYSEDDANVMATGQILDREEEYPSLDGEPCWVRVVKTPLFDEQQRITGLQGIFWDISERRQMDEALRNAERNYRNLFENAIQGIFRTSADGRILLANPALARMFGYSSPEEMIASVHSIEEQLYANAEDRREFKRLMAKQGEVKEYVIQQKRKDGSLFWTSFNARAITDENGEIACYEGRIEDISERKRAQEILKRYELLSKHARDIILFISRDGHILEANEAALHAYGYDRQEILALRIHDLRAPHTRHLTEALIEKAFAEGFTIESEHQRKDGSVFPIEASTRGVDLGGEKVLLSVIRDITARKEAEEERHGLEAQLRQAQKMEAIGTLAGGIAHDFNNILGIIMGYAEITALSLGRDAREKSTLDEVIKATHRAKELVKQILTFSRRSEQERLPLQLIPIVKEAMKLLRSSLPTTIEIRQGIELSQGHDLILADPTQIHQLLMNLSTNAAHAMGEKGGVLQITLSPVQWSSLEADRSVELTPGEYLKLTVEDNGHGMDPDTLDHIFEPYFTTKGPSEGTGLGLAVVHGIVKSHHGAIAVCSEPAKGTAFHIYLPRLESGEPLKQETFREIPTGSERILLVDDEEMLVRALKQMLERLGYQVTGVTSSADALLKFREQPDHFDLIVSDYTMPRMTGIDLAEYVRHLPSDIPIILCTGFSERISEEALKKWGIAALLMKPVTLRSIAELIRKVVDG